MLGAPPMFVFLAGGCGTAADWQRAVEGWSIVRLSMGGYRADSPPRQERCGGGLFSRVALQTRECRINSIDPGRPPHYLDRLDILV